MSNILVNAQNNEIKYIDFEHSEDLIFFYDIFFLIWFEFLINEDTRYIKSFTNGDYDVYFSKMFKLFNLDYKPQYKIDYLNVFFLILFKKRWINFNETTRKNKFIKYKELIEVLNNI